MNRNVKETSSLKDDGKINLRSNIPCRVAPAFCTRFLAFLVRFLGVTKLQRTFHPLRANFSSFEDGNHGVSIHSYKVGSHGEEGVMRWQPEGGF